MCGIAGLVAPGNKQETLERAAAAMVHRGPDDAGFFQDDNAGLAVRRLSIIDLEGGAQPISNEDDSIHVIQNGEIVNAPELRAQLQQLGHHFRTHSDTEVLVHAYEEWGDGFPARLRGMFALAIWDARRQRLFLARDRLGIKPLFTAFHNGGFAFASDLQSLVHLLPDMPRRADRTYLWQLFEIGIPIQPRTAFEGIEEFPPATTMVVEDGRKQTATYWSLEFNDGGSAGQLDFDAAAAGLLEKVEDAVRAWRLSDVPVGSLLSGGIDSAAVASTLTKISPDPIRTFTLRFPGRPFDESAAARMTSEALGTRHEEVDFTDAEYDLLPQVIAHLGSPACSLVSLTLAALFRTCHNAGFKVILSGEGSDEIFGGYDWFSRDYRLHRFLGLPAPLRRIAARLAPNISPITRRIMEAGTPDSALRYCAFQETIPESLRRGLFAGSGESAYGPLLESLEGRSGRHPFRDFIRLEMRARLVTCINRRVDRMSMMYSVEARPPLMDHHIWEYAASLPPEMHIGSKENKRLLRAAMRRTGTLPEAILRQPKRGLRAPQINWWHARQLPEWAEEHLTPQALDSTGYFDQEAVHDLRAAHRRREINASKVLTGVLTTQIWHASFIG